MTSAMGTWNAIGKRKGAWALDPDTAPETTKGFLLNHLIHELLPAKGDGLRWANSDPITGQAAWFDLRVWHPNLPCGQRCRRVALRPRPVSRTHFIEGHGGTKLFTRDSGPENAPAILLIHGWSQSSLSWTKQAPLAEHFRLITPDLRGHGQSDKPDAPELYNQSDIWAADIQAIIDTLELDQPLLVGWSMGSWLIGDYLRTFGQDSIAGLSLVGGCVTTGQNMPETARKRRPEIAATNAYHPDTALQIPAIVDFLKACTAAPLSKRDLAIMTGFNMLCPPHIRKAARMRHEDYRPDYANLTKPALLIHGAAEKVLPLPMLEQSQATIPHATTHLYNGVGHAPFWEDAPRFNKDLHAFASSIFPKILPPEAPTLPTSETANP